MSRLSVEDSTVLGLTLDRDEQNHVAVRIQSLTEAIELQRCSVALSLNILLYPQALKNYERTATRLNAP